MGGLGCSRGTANGMPRNSPAISMEPAARPPAVSAPKVDCAGPRKKKASLEGMSEAFGPSAGADGQRTRPGRRRRPQFRAGVMRRCEESGQTRSRKPSYAFLDSKPEPQSQKKRLHPKMEPDDRIEILIESSGKWTREEENAICRVARSPGRRRGLQTGCRRSEPREEDTVRLTSTLTI